MSCTISPQNMSVIKRDDESFELTFKDVDGNLIDLTGSTVFFTVKKKQSDADADAVIAKEITSFVSLPTGIAILYLTNADTDIDVGTYYFDIQLKNAQDKISSTEVGRFTVTRDITIRTT